MPRKLTIYTNFTRMNGVQAGDCQASVKPITIESGWGGLAKLHRMIKEVDVVLINVDLKLVGMLCLLAAFSPGRRWRLVWVDPILTPPTSMFQRMSARLKSLLFRNVDRFVVYFRDTEGYRRHYGIQKSKTVYVPFKVNTWSKFSDTPEPVEDGGFVLAAGRSRRDLPTFIAAMRQLPEIPALLLHQPDTSLLAHGTKPLKGELPPNVTSLEDSGDDESWRLHLSRARIVTIPLLRNTIAPSGISTYLDAMALWKCVVISESPATRGLISNEAIIVQPENPVDLAAGIRRAWEDDDFRRATARAGRRYAERLQGEPRLLQDLLTVCDDLVKSSSSEIPVRQES